jgi:simple sugar transport system permease protein
MKIPFPFPPGPRRESGHRDLLALAGILLATFLLMWALNPARFLALNNIKSMAFQMPELGFLSLAMMVTMVTGGINLSIIATANLSGIAAALAMKAAEAHGAGAFAVVAAALLAALAVSLLIGLVNGCLIAFVEVSPILATLGVMTLLNGISILLTKGYVISEFPEGFRYVGNGLFLGLPVPIILFALAAAATSLALSRTAFGFELYMVGTNPVATRFAGVDNRRVLLKTYLLSGALCGLAAIVMISRFNSAKSDYGASYLLITVLAAVLGGTSVFGGFGKVLGLVLALVTLQLLSSGLNLLQANAFLTRAIWGLVLILVTVINSYSGSSPGGERT